MSAPKAPSLLNPNLPRKSGRAVFDESGRTTWEWQTSTGVFERFITDEQLQRLESPTLAILEEPQEKMFAWTGSHTAFNSRTHAPSVNEGAMVKLLKRIVGKR